MCVDGSRDGSAVSTCQGTPRGHWQTAEAGGGAQNTLSLEPSWDGEPGLDETFVFPFFLFSAAPEAYGSSQARS